MNNPTYEQRLRAIAEEMAKNDFTYSITHFKEAVINKKLVDARIAVAQRAAGIRAYAIYCAAVPADKNYTVDQYLKEQGLIPDTEQEAASNGTI